MFANSLLYFCNETIKFFTEDQLYLYNDHQLIAVLPGNDIRSVDKHLALYQNKISQSYAQSITSESFHIHIIIFYVSCKMSFYKLIKS